MFFKKKIVGLARKTILRRSGRTPMKLTYTIKNLATVEANDKTRKQTIDNTRISQQGSNRGDMNSHAMHRAKEVQSKLPPEYPSFVKYMVKSHVSGGFWLGLPKSFCKMHMPKKDETIVLVDDRVEEHRVKYLVKKDGLSAGWKGFSVNHKLVEGDVLVFQLIESLKFKVYIMRVSQMGEIDGSMDIHANTSLKRYGMENRETVGTVNGLDSEPIANTINEHGSEDVEGIRLAKYVSEFKDIKGFDSFNILVDGLIIDTEIPIHIRYKYYELCRNQKSFLHDDLVKGLNCKLVAGIISETVNIADAIKAVKFTVSLEILQSWDKTLKAFDDMGMRVGFLRTCLNKLVCLLNEQQKIIISKKLEQARLQEEIRDLVTNLSKRREVKKTLDAEIAALMTKDLSVEITFKNIANAAY